MALSFNDFVQFELPKRPFSEEDGLPGQVPVRSSRIEAPRELVWVDMPTGVAELTLQAGATGVSGHRAVMIAADGKVVHADPLEARSYVGISKHAAVADAPIKIATRDEITEMSWTWVPGQIVFFIADGMLTQTVPAETAVTPVGLAISATTILISRDAPVFL